MEESQVFEEQIAVLYAIQSAQADAWPVTPPSIFRFLPKILRDRWHVHYLRTVMLRKLERDGWVEIIPLDAGVLHYRLTLKARRALM